MPTTETSTPVGSWSWRTGPAQLLERQRRAAAVDRAEVLLTLGRADELTRFLPGVLTADPYDERGHGQLMRAFVATGRRAAALATFEQLRTRLRDELGVDPDPDLRGLHEEILRHDVLPTPPSAPPSASAHTLARRTSPLLGRARDLDELSDLLPKASLLTLTGSGGVGKTSLAEHLVARAGDTWSDGVLSCNLAHVRDGRAVDGALVTALALQPARGQTPTQALVSGLGERHLLLFLDNCEHVLEAVTGHIEAIVTGCPRVTVLATSRERLRLPSERVWPVSPLEVPPADAAAAEVLGTAAGALFHARAQAVEPHFDLDAGNAGAVAELCRRLDGLPLAIELAAARVRALSPQALVERLDQRFALLTGGPRREEGRHRTLEAVVAWSYQLLAPEEADLFDRLAVFAGAVPLSAVEALCADDTLPRASIAGLLGELVDKSMVVVQRDGAAVRYRLLDTMRDFASRRLQDRGIAQDVRRAHAAHYLVVAETQGERVRGAQEAQAVATITGAMDDLRAAHAWAVEQGEVDVALRLPGALPEEVCFRLRDEVTTWARRALELPGARSHPAWPRALTTAAWGATSRDECERAVQEATEAHDAVDPTSPVALSAGSAHATAALYQGRLTDVLTLADRHQQAMEAAGTSYHLAFLWVYRILALLYRGDSAAAAGGLPAVHETARDSGSPTMQAFAHYCDGEVHLDDDPDRAAAALEEAVRLGRTVSNRLVEGVALVCLASSQGRRGDPALALRAYRDVVVHWRRVGNHTHQLTAVRNLVPLLARVGADVEAAFLYGAVTSAGTPTFGVEEERLAGAWEQVESRLGPAPAEQRAARGRGVESRLVGTEALAVLDSLLGD